MIITIRSFLKLYHQDDSAKHLAHPESHIGLQDTLPCPLEEREIKLFCSIVGEERATEEAWRRNRSLGNE